MQRRSGLALWVVAVAAAAVAAEAAKPGAGAALDFGKLGGNRKEPITVNADRLEFDYKANVVTYRGSVVAEQGDVKLRSDVLAITFVGQPKGLPDARAGAGRAADPKPGAEQPADAPPKDTAPPTDDGAASKVQLRTIVATGNVRIDQTNRWATGGKAVFDQTTRTLVLSEKPVLHEGQNEVSGERVVVYLDENRSVVEGGPARRVQAILYPDKGGGLAAERPGPAPGAAR